MNFLKLEEKGFSSVRVVFLASSLVFVSAWASFSLFSSSDPLSLLLPPSQPAKINLPPSFRAQSNQEIVPINQTEQEQAQLLSQDQTSPNQPSDQLLSCSACLATFEIKKNSIQDHHLAKGSVEKDELARRSVYNHHLHSGAVSSRVIEDGTIQSKDLASQIEINQLLIAGSLNLQNHSIINIDSLTATTAQLTTLDLGTNTITDGYLNGDWYVSGNLGIGTTAPTQKLQVAGVVESTTGGFKLPDGTIIDDSGDLGGGGSSLWTQTGSDIYYSSGNVGIGTTAPNYQLSLGSNLSDTKIALWDGGGSNSFGIGVASSELIFHLNNSNDRYTFYDDGSKSNSLLTIMGNGNVGIGTTAPSQKVDLIGSLELQDTTTATAGVIYKGADRFVHDFHHPTGGSVAPAGQNTFIGIDSGNFTMGSTATHDYHGSYNTAFGYQAFTSNTTGYQNSAFGNGTLFSNTVGYQNLALGYLALYDNTTGHHNVAGGNYSLYNNTGGNYNSAFGQSTLYSNINGDSNSAFGSYSLYSNTEGDENTAFGYYTGYSNLTGEYNSAFGFYSFVMNTTGNYNTSFGYMALTNNSTASYNSAFGPYALYANTTGYQNTGFGHTALYSNTTGFLNSALGSNAGRFIANGSTANQLSNTSLYLGADTKALASGDVNETVIGYNTIGFGSNTFAYGNGNITKHIFQSGNLGIGTTNPGAKLQVVASTNDGSTNIFSGLDSDEAGVFSVNSDGKVYAPQVHPLGDTSSYLELDTKVLSIYVNWSNMLHLDGNAREMVVNPHPDLYDNDFIIQNYDSAIYDAVEFNQGNQTWTLTKTDQYIIAGQSGTASLYLWADEGDDSQDKWSLKSDGTGFSVQEVYGSKYLFLGYNSGVVVNAGGDDDVDFQVQSDADTHAFFVDAGNNGYAAFGTDTVVEQATIDGRIYLADSSAPGTTTNRLYAVSGSLFWNGTQLGGSTPVWTTTGSDIYYSTGNVGIGLTAPSQALDLIGAFELQDTTTATAGVIYKGAISFIHNFHHPTGNTAVPDGNNIFIGEGAGNFTLGSTATGTYQGSNNVVIGAATGDVLTKGFRNILIGNEAGGSLDEGWNNIFIGHEAGAAFSGNYGDNIFIGYRAGVSATNCGENVVIGKYAGDSITTASKSVYVGTGAGGADSNDGFNTALGYETGTFMRSPYNVLIGYHAGREIDYYSATQDGQNVMIGAYAGTDSEQGERNVYVGYYAGSVTQTGEDNVYIGHRAGYFLRYGKKNIAIGPYALADADDADDSIFIGYRAGYYYGSGTSLNGDSQKSIGIGYEVRPSASGNTNEIIIGNDLVGNGSNSVTIGDSNITKTILAGNIGIGTTDPLAPLHVSASDSNGNWTYEGLQISSPARTMALYLGVDQTNDFAWIQAAYPGDTYDKDLILQPSNGNVGIGTTAPNQKLDIVGNARIQSIGSGAYDAPVNQTSDGTLTTATSDVRMKKNVELIDSPLEKILSLRGVYFNWKEGSDRRMLGMIAQEVNEVVPELVFQNSVDGYFGINYAEMSGLLVEGMKEQNAQIISNQLSMINLDAKLEDLETNEAVAVLGNRMDLLNDKTAQNEEFLTFLEENQEELTITIENLISLTDTMTQMLSDHEQRLQALEAGIVVAGETAIKLELSEELQALEESITLSEDGASIQLDLEGNLKAKEVEAEQVRATKEDVFIENVERGVIMKSPLGECFRFTANEEGEMESEKIDCPENSEEE